MIHLTIPIIAPSLNTWYSGQHWSKRKQIADVFHQHIKLICKKEKIQPITKYPVKITTRSFYKKKRSYDCSNVFTANKLCEDGLVRAGILKDDTPQYVSGHEILCPIFGYKEDMTIVIVEPTVEFKNDKTGDISETDLSKLIPITKGKWIILTAIRG